MDIEIRAYSDLKISKEELKRVTIEHLCQKFNWNQGLFIEDCEVHQGSFSNGPRKKGERGTYFVRQATDLDKAVNLILKNL